MPPSAIEVRPVESFAEYRAAMRTWRLGWRTAFDGILPASSLPAADVPADRLDRLEAAYEDVTANDAVFVAVRADESAPAVVGYAHVLWDAERTEPFVPAGDAELKALYVHPDRWGEGIGTALLDAVESAVSERADRLVLQTFAENEDGRAFYRARGFETDGEGSYEVDGESYRTVVFAAHPQTEPE